MKLLDYTKELIITLDAEGKIFYSNKSAQIVFGYSDSEFSIKKLVDLISKDNYFNYTEKILDAVNNTILEDVVLLNSEGKNVHTNIRVIELSENPREIALYITDLTRRYEFRREVTSKIKTIETLSKSSIVRQGSMDEALDEILKKSLEAVGVSRVNVWVTKDKSSYIECIGSCSSMDGQIKMHETKGQKLLAKELPKYFEMINKEEIIVTDDVLDDPQTAELVDSYLIPNQITSMIDIPLLSNGEMIGVICFEHTGPMRRWNVFEIKFGYLIAQIISLLMEGYEKSKLAERQIELVTENQELYKEANSRIKYVFNLMNALMQIDQDLCKDDFHRSLCQNIKTNMLRISGALDVVLSSPDYSRIDMEKTVLRVFGYLSNLYPQAQNVKFDLKVNKVVMPVSEAMTLTLIIGELIKLSFDRYGFGNAEAKITMSIQQGNGSYQMTYKDNSSKLTEEEINGGAMEIKIAELFAQDLGSDLNITVGNEGNKYVVNFPSGTKSKLLEVPVN